MSIQNQAINAAAKVLLDASFWTAVKQAVKDADGQTNLTGDQKRAAVKADLFAVFGHLGSAVLNLGIELAVNYVNTLPKK